MKSAEHNLILFLRKNPEWHSSGQLQRMEWRNRNGTLATPRSIVRRLQENAEGDNAILEVEYRGQSTYYRVKTAHIKPKYTYQEITKDGQVVWEETRVQ